MKKITFLHLEKLKNSMIWCGMRSLALGAVSAVLTALPANAAERIYFNYGPFEFSVAVRALATFAQSGKVEPELATYLNRFSPQQQAQLREFLQARYKVSHVRLSRLFYARTGERLLRSMGEIVKTKAGQNAAYGMRGALILAAAEPEGLNAVDLLQKFPTDIQVNIGKSLQLIKSISTLVKETDAVVKELNQISQDLAASEPPSNFNQLPDLRASGKFSTSKQTLHLRDAVRDRQLVTDLYLPEINQPQVPVIVISNGLGARRDLLTYLAQHLASHGFAVAIPDHPGSSRQRQQEFYAGLHSLAQENFDVTEFIDRPLDITFLLNELEQLNKLKFKYQLNLQQVGIFGYSFGSTTALALAGAEINFEQLAKDCSSYQMLLMNISLSYQCRALELPRSKLMLQDERIKAAYLFVPFTKSIFGQAGMSRVNIPIFWEASDEDVVTPLLLEQLPAFNWLTTTDKYLVVSEGLPHTGVILRLMSRFTKKEMPLDKLAQVSQSYHKALSLAFFKVYVDQNDDYRRYLQATYTQAITEKPYNLNFVRTTTQVLDELSDKN